MPGSQTGDGPCLDRNGAALGCGWSDMDALSEVLSSVRITGAFFFHAEFTAPWRTLALAAKEVAPTLSPGTERLVNYHLVTEGRAFARIEGSPDVALEAGD